MNQNPSVKTVDCPRCKTAVEWCEKNTYRPFCSQRCRDQDFMAWANEENTLAGNSIYDDVLSQDLDLE